MLENVNMAKWRELFGYHKALCASLPPLGPFHLPCIVVSVGIVQAPQMLDLL